MPLRAACAQERGRGEERPPTRRASNDTTAAAAGWQARGAPAPASEMLALLGGHCGIGRSLGGAAGVVQFGGRVLIPAAMPAQSSSSAAGSTMPRGIARTRWHQKARGWLAGGVVRELGARDAGGGGKRAGRGGHR